MERVPHCRQNRILEPGNRKGNCQNKEEGMKKKILDILLSITLAAGMAAGLAGCGSTGAASEGSTTSSGP